MSLRCWLFNWHKVDSEQLRKNMEHVHPEISYRKTIYFGVHDAFCVRCGVKIMGRISMKNYDETRFRMKEKYIYIEKTR